jgi:hypothetical protein
VSVFESQATFNVEEATIFEPGMPITTVNLKHNLRILDTIFCTAQTHCKHKHDSLLIDVCNLDRKVAAPVWKTEKYGRRNQSR